MHDDGNGACAIGENGNPWAVARRVVGLTDIRSCVPEAVQYRNIPGDSRSFYTREAFNVTLRLEQGFDNASLISLTNYRSGEGESQFSQTGLGPDAPGLQPAFRNALAARNLALTQALGLAFDFPVREREDLKQFVQELRLVSDFADTAWDYIAGLYFQRDTVDKNDVFWGESLLGRGPLGGLNGESEWFNKATTAYDPETVLSIEAGLKSEFWNRRLRVNGAIFSMDYSDLQVEFTNDQCLCNIVSQLEYGPVGSQSWR